VTGAAEVQVVTAGTDWPAIVTGVVGLVGIVLAHLQGRYSQRRQAEDVQATLDAATQDLRMSITAEDARARLADRRKIYVHCLVELSALRAAAVRVRAEQGHGAAHAAAAMDAFRQAVLAAHEAVWPVVISGSPEVAKLAGQFVASVSNALDPGQDAAFRQAQNALIRAMRADLSAPAGGERLADAEQVVTAAGLNQPGPSAEPSAARTVD
jgi:hypothetical protein